MHANAVAWTPSLEKESVPCGLMSEHRWREKEPSATFFPSRLPAPSRSLHPKGGVGYRNLAFLGVVESARFATEFLRIIPKTRSSALGAQTKSRAKPFFCDQQGRNGRHHPSLSRVVLNGCRPSIVMISIFFSRVQEPEPGRSWNAGTGEAES